MTALGEWALVRTSGLCVHQPYPITVRITWAGSVRETASGIAVAVMDDVAREWGDTRPSGLDVRFQVWSLDPLSTWIEEMSGTALSLMAEGYLFRHHGYDARVSVFR